MYSSQEPPHHASPEGEGTDWGMLKILAVLFDTRQRGVEDGVASSYRAAFDAEAVWAAAKNGISSGIGSGLLIRKPCT